MRTFLSRATLVAITLAISFSAQVSYAQGQSGNVAVIDIFAVFKGYPRFEKMMEDVKKDAKAEEERFRLLEEDIRKAAQPLSQYKVGSLEYKDLEESLAKRRSELTIDMKIAQKGFTEREAQVFYNVYNEIVKEVELFARRANITLVLRYVRTPIDPQLPPKAIMQGIGKPVVYQNNIDITNDILSALNRKVAPRVSPRNTIPRRR